MSTIQASFKALAEKASCAEIDMVGKSDFARVWVYSLIYGLTLALGITIPFRWCRSGKKSIRIHTSDEVDEAGRAPSSPKLGFGDSNTEGFYGNPEPDIAKAQEHLRKTSATHKDSRSKTYKWQNPLFTPVERLNDLGGTGTELYFRNLRNLGFIFAYMAALTSPIAAFNMLGNFGPDTGQALLKSAIGNLGSWEAASHLDPSARIVQVGCQGWEIQHMTAIFGWLDFAAIIIFLIYTVWFRFIQVPRAALQDSAEQVTPRDFAVVIDKLPHKIENQKDYAKLLEEHILSRLAYVRSRQKHPDSRQSEVVEITFVRDYGGRLANLRSRAELVQTKEILQKYDKPNKIAKIDKALNKLNEKLAEHLEDEETLPVLRAFVILSNTSDVANLLYDYRFAEYTLFRCCQSSSRRFQGSGIRVRQAPQPTDLIWENQDTKWEWRLARRALMFLIFFIIMCISLGMIYTLSTLGAKLGSGAQLSYIGVPKCDPIPTTGFDSSEEQYKCLITEAATWNRTYAEGQGGDILKCWCTFTGFEAMMKDRTLFDTCESWLTDVGQTVGISVGASIIVLVINLVLQMTLLAMSEFEKPLSQTALNSSMMQKVFFAQTMNTGFVLFMVNLQLKWLKPIVRIVPVVGRFLFDGPFDDITRGWYGVVGVTILTNMALQTVVPACTSIALMMATWITRKCRRGGCKHQAELLKLYTNPRFDIKGKYAQMLTVVFVTMTYSSGLPLLNLFASIYMFFMYWADKFVLLWGSKRPPNYDTTMAKESSDFMLYAIPLHCVFAILMYGQDCVFPSNNLGGDLGNFADLGRQAVANATAAGTNASANATSAATITLGSSDTDIIAGLFNRVAKESTWMIFLLLVLLVAFWVLWFVAWIIGGTFGAFWDCLVDTCCPSRKMRRITREEAAEALARGETKINGRNIDIASTMDWVAASVHIEATFPPASYRLEKHPDLATIAHLLRSEIQFTPKAKKAPTTTAPVPGNEAKGFLEALNAQFVLKTQDDAVSKFLEGHTRLKSTLTPFEEQVSKADDKDAAVQSIADSWGMRWP
eukprot:TRINITY_DN5987_c0_g2_i3.p1 TRINITY_DN5987_c0_g2~~TRINITY_DN5987_c0_g2_i3.p1  ORF type:complete len:1063 (+),score=153.55 TRINITY_DN5987_c0_g2_i3:43-3189(+)